jgi:iron(III) transport system ATP-binding protein
MIALKNISFKYKRSKEDTINDISFSLDEGKVLAVVGPSGGGKSTLLRIISGLETPHQGEIHINQTDMTYVKPEKRTVGMLFQDYALFPHMTVGKNIGYGLGKRLKNKKARIREMLDLVDMADYEKRYPHELSGGQQQRIALARALAPSPNILLLDEPFSNLDTELLTSIRSSLFKIIKSLGITTIMVTHNNEDASLFADQTIRIENGKIKAIK